MGIKLLRCIIYSYSMLAPTNVFLFLTVPTVQAYSFYGAQALKYKRYFTATVRSTVSLPLR